MSSTILKLKGHITAEQVIKYINEHYSLIDSEIKEENYGSLDYYDWVIEKYGDSNELKTTSGIITFDSGNANKKLFYYYQNVNGYDNLKYYSMLNLEDMVISETTYLSLFCHDNSVEIMKGIAQEFGGWIEEDVENDEPPYWIDKTRYCWSYDGDCYTGSFDTEKEAIEVARENLGEYDEQIYVGTCEKATLSWNSNEEEIIESMYDNLYEEYGEPSESFEVTNEQSEELAKRIDKCVEQWINDMNIKPNCWGVGNIHLVN